MGDGEKRVRGRWVCAKEHLTFAFFSPRVWPGWTDTATAEGRVQMPRGKNEAASRGGYGWH